MGRTCEEDVIGEGAVDVEIDLGERLVRPSMRPSLSHLVVLAVIEVVLAASLNMSIAILVVSAAI